MATAAAFSVASAQIIPTLYVSRGKATPGVGIVIGIVLVVDVNSRREVSRRNGTVVPTPTSAKDIQLFIR
jgi:hypothetical protein